LVLIDSDFFSQNQLEQFKGSLTLKIKRKNSWNLAQFQFSSVQFFKNSNNRPALGKLQLMMKIISQTPQ
jgi:hypothetical protein